MANAIETFMRWWNYLATRNGKLKFKNQREASDFVRQMHDESGGPNDKLLEMRRQYDAANRERLDRESA